MNKLFTYSAVFPIVFVSFISIFFIPGIINFYSKQSCDEVQFEFKFFKMSNSPTSLNYSNDYNLLWPVPGYNTITSKFGYRTAPASGASKYHGGIDIAVPVRN